MSIYSSGLVPEYLASSNNLYIPGREGFRSASDCTSLQEPKCHHQSFKSVADKAFSLAAPMLWNNIPISVRIFIYVLHLLYNCHAMLYFSPCAMIFFGMELHKIYLYVCMSVIFPDFGSTQNTKCNEHLPGLGSTQNTNTIQCNVHSG